MSSYTNTPEINALYQEQQQVKQAIDMLDAGGSVPSFVVSPPTQQSPEGYPMPTTQMAVSINTIAPSEALLSDAYDALVKRHNDISNQLQALGVTDAPIEEVRKYSKKSEGKSEK